MKKTVCIILAVLLALASASCGAKRGGVADDDGGVLGRWHSEVLLSDLEKLGVPEELRLLKLITGSKLFDIYAQFNDDGTFSYDISADELESNLTRSAKTVVGFMSDYDVSELVEKAVACMFGYADDNLKLNYAGEYTLDEDGKVVATDGIPFFFTLSAGTLSQTDMAGNVFLRFSKV